MALFLFVCWWLLGIWPFALTGLVEEKEVAGVTKCGSCFQCGELGDGRRESAAVVFKG